MKDLYDRRFVRFDWDDDLEGKECIVGDSIRDIKMWLDARPDSVRIVRKNPNSKDLFPFIDNYEILYRFCYYDPLLKYKVAKKEGKRIECRFVEDGYAGLWKEMTDDVWTQTMEYRIVEEKKVSAVLTRQQLCMWLAKGNGEYMYKGMQNVYSDTCYNKNNANDELDENILVRRWGDEWHEPTVEYCFPDGIK